MQSLARQDNDDRYLLMLPHTDLGQTRTVAERLHQLFAELVIAIDGRELAMTLSAGITACSDQTTLFFDTFVGQAETALDYALVNGGNRIASFGEAQLQTDAAPEPGAGLPAEGPPQRRDDDQESGRR